MSAANGPWARFFNQHPLSVQEGMGRAMSKAFSSAFDPLSLSASNLPAFPNPKDAVQLSNPKEEACSVPLLEYKVSKDKQFFIRQLKQGSALDAGIARLPPAVPCKE